MWAVSNQKLSMVEGDYGIQLPCEIKGITFTASDSIALTIKSAINGDVIISRQFTNIQNNTINIELTEQESALLPVGNYVYLLDWYQDGNFMCNVIPYATFAVVEKA